MERRDTREVPIGNVTIGGSFPIAIQSMTTSDTNDIERSVNEVLRLAAAGASIVRLTVPSLGAVDSLRRIRERLLEGGVDLPLAADVHYAPKAALAAAAVVEKVRINPGNFADRRERSREGESYGEGAARAAETFGPLVECLKERKGALRIGVNHGSLAERITTRFGNTPEGMVESAIEYIRVCEGIGFFNVVVSLKSSIPAVTVAANRLFAERIDSTGGRYPLHLGVTEAGAGEEGRIRSASGIGTLLTEGLGDTIRVSLTEDPVKEIPAARAILDLSMILRVRREGSAARGPWRREVPPLSVGSIGLGGNEPVAVIAEGGLAQGRSSSVERPDLLLVDREAEIDGAIVSGHAVLLRTTRPDTILPDLERLPNGLLFSFPGGEGVDWARVDRAISRSGVLPFVELEAENTQEIAPQVDHLLELLPSGTAGGVVVGAPNGSPADLIPVLEKALVKRSLPWPILVAADGGEGLVATAISLSPPLLEGLGHVLYVGGGGGEAVAWSVLQGTRRRITRVEYISCPSCGRTLFDLEETTNRIRERTSHLKNIKIAVMGCIVNGPGEMADADFGYVGSGPGRVDFYVGSERVEKSIREEVAVERLVDLLRECGRWIEP